MNSTSDQSPSPQEQLLCRGCKEPTLPFVERCFSCGIEHPSDEFLGTTIRGNIDIESIIGTGGMGIVYKGVETHLHRPVAVKVLHNNGQITTRNIEYFMREARLLSRLRHPNLVAVLDFGQEEDGTLFLVLEYIPGKTLEDLLEHENFTHERSLRVLIQVLGALEEVHRHQIIHRDLKPGNVLLEQVAGQGDFVKVLDFGIAKILQNEEEKEEESTPKAPPRTFRTEIGTAVGTPQYMSPEQAQGQPVDIRSDIYSAGLLLYEMTTGTLPHEGSNIFEVMMRKVGEAPMPPSLRSPEKHIPEIVDHICMRALSQNPEDRYPNAASFRKALEDALMEIRQRNMLTRTPPKREPTQPDEATSEDGPLTTLMAISAIVFEDPSVSAPTNQERTRAIWDYVHRVIQKSGGVTEEPVGGSMIARFPDTPSGSSLARAATTALQLKTSATRHFVYARLKMGLVRGHLHQDTTDDRERAQYLADLANGNQILADPHQCESLRDILRVEERNGALELLEPRGLDRPSVSLPSFPVTPNHNPKITSSRPSIPSRPTLSLKLEKIFHRISQGRPGAAILLTGEEGIGKSHAVDYVRRLARGMGMPTLEADCHEQRVDRPMRPLFDLVTQAIGERGEVASTSPGQIPEKLRKGLSLLGLHERTCQDLVEQYISGTPDDPWILFTDRGQALTHATLRRAQHLFPRQEKRLIMTSALRQVARKITAAGGAIIILEDIDRADLPTRACLPGLCALTRETPLFVLVTSQEETLEGLDAFEHIPLSPIPSERLRSFWGALGNAHKSKWGAYQREDRAVSQETAMLRASKGSPLYMTRWLHSPLKTPPENAHELIAAQVAQLPGRFKRLLIIVAVLGEYFEESVLEGLFPRSKALSTALEGAAADGWIERCPGTPGTWRFANPMLRRAIYRALAQDERRRYHQNVYEGLLHNNPSSHKLLLEHTHARKSGNIAQMVNLSQMLGDRFVLAGDSGRGLEFYLTALKGREHLSKIGAPLQDDDQLFLKTANTMLQVGQFSRVRMLLRRHESKDPQMSLRSCTLQVRALIAGKEFQKSLLLANETLKTITGEPIYMLELLELAAEAFSLTNRPEEASLTLKRAFRILNRRRRELPDDLLPISWRLWLTRATLQARAQDLEESEASLLEGLTRAQKAKDLQGITRIVHALTSLGCQRKQPLRARALCGEVLANKELHFRPGQRVALLHCLARLHRALGKEGAARQAIQQAQSISREVGLRDRITQDSP